MKVNKYLRNLLTLSLMRRLRIQKASFSLLYTFGDNNISVSDVVNGKKSLDKKEFELVKIVSNDINSVCFIPI